MNTETYLIIGTFSKRNHFASLHHTCTFMQSSVDLYTYLLLFVNLWHLFLFFYIKFLPSVEYNIYHPFLVCFITGFLLEESTLVLSLVYTIHAILKCTLLLPDKNIHNCLKSLFIADVEAKDFLMTIFLFADFVKLLVKLFYRLYHIFVYLFYTFPMFPLL